MNAADLDVRRTGSGPPVVLVHGSIVEAPRTWRHQLELAERWSLCIPNRPGFGDSPPNWWKWRSGNQTPLSPARSAKRALSRIRSYLPDSNSAE